jgi:glutamate racemase
MKRHLKTILLTALAAQFLCACIDRKSYARQNELADFFLKKDVTIAVTDSGLGGLAIMADAVERMRSAKMFRKVDFVFFNALFSNSIGYNGLRTRKEKVQVFDNAISSIEKIYNPDLILIGCNTLSVLYKSTEYSKRTRTPVMGILDAGVNQIAQNLKDHPDSRVLLFATQTTVREAAHKKDLADKGFLEERIILQACPDLGAYIERGAESDETEMLIFAYADEALQKTGNHYSSLYVSLNCTHYGYSLPLWKKAFESHGIKPLAFLNPNSKMIDTLFPDSRLDRVKSTELSAAAVSMVKIDEQKINSIGKWLSDKSPLTAKALKNYEFRESLFEWKKFVSSSRLAMRRETTGALPPERLLTSK